LIIGAGPLGSLFAARLHQAGHDVSILARGPRLAELRQHGIVLEEFHTGRQEVASVRVVEALMPDDAYDLVLVIMRKNHVAGVLPVLAANRNTPNVLFLGNNCAGPDELVEALGPERVLIGFPNSAGDRQGHAVRYVGWESEEKAVIPIGEPDGSIGDRTGQVAAILSTMPGYDVEIRTDMDAWLKTHVALLMPSIAPAFYACGLDRRRVARTRDAVVLAVRAVREAFAVLRALGVPVVPARIPRLVSLPEPILVPLLRRIVTRDELEVAMIGHLRAAPDEMKHLAGEFLALARVTTVPTPAIDCLSAYFDPATPLMPDGSAEIPLDYRGLALGLAALATLTAGLYLLTRRPHRRT
jgi:2-dehydropantoate 2-reductase